MAMLLQIKDTRLFLDLKDIVKNIENYKGSAFFEESSEHENILFNLVKRKIKTDDFVLSLVFIFDNRFEFHSKYCKETIIINK